MKLAIIGCGAFAHLYHFPALKALRNVDLVGIADPRPSDETRRLAANEDVLLVSDVDTLLGEAAADAVLVSSPHALHAEHVEKALLAQKHVLVDKPFVLATRDAIRLTELARSQRRVGAVAFNRRLDRGYLRARSILEGGLLGAICHIDSTQLGYPRCGWVAEDPGLAGGGPFIGRGAHLADAVPWLVGNEPRTIRASVVPPHLEGNVDRGGYWDVGMDNVTWRATILADGPDLYDEVRIFGETGWLSLKRPSTLSTWPPPHGLDQLPSWELSTSVPGWDTDPTPPPTPGPSALADFARAIAEKGEPSCSFAEAGRSVRLVEAAYISSESGSVVDIQRNGDV